MKQISQIYTGIDDFTELLYESDIDVLDNCFVRLFTSNKRRNDIESTIQQIKSVLPNCTIVGSTSTKAVVHRCEQYENKSVIIVNSFDNFVPKVKIFSWKDKTDKEILEEILSKYTANEELINIIFSNTSKQIYSVLDTFIQHTNFSDPVLKLVGGVAGAVLDKSYVFANDTILEDGVLLFCLEDKNFEENYKAGTTNYFTHISTAADEISELHEVTKMEGANILEIENVPAIEWFYEFLQVEEDDDLTFEEFKQVAKNKYFTSFTIMSNKHNDMSRCINYDCETDSLSLYTSEMSVGTKFRVCYLSPKKVMRESYLLCGTALLESIQSMFVYSCHSRKSYLTNATKVELKPLQNNDISGVFFHGEICFYDGQNNLYNASSCVVGFAEAESKLLVDTTILKEEDVQADMQFFDKAIMLQSQMDTNSEDVNNSKFYDAEFGMPNIVKYKHDLNKKLFDKIAMIEITTADSTIAYVGQEKFYETSKDIWKVLEGIVTDKHVREYLNFYIVNYKTYIITCSNAITQDDFTKFVRELHSELGFVTSEKTNISEVARFVVVPNCYDMIKVGTSALYANRSSQENFIVCKDFELEIDNLADETFYIELIKRAIDNNSVVPHYQGMRNNETDTIDKYEALMRIEDDGKVYYPNSFLEVAKKFKLYNKISKIMITKVLDEFEDRDEAISINVSLYDIESTSFREWIINRLRNYRKPDRVVVEFVETEECNDLNLMKEFIKDVRSCGSKIAIDDFGSGYSTFATIANLSPDFIKIDGSIVSEISTNDVNLKILNTICYLAKSLSINTIAEYVDSAAVQALVKENDVNHSQGFYFSKPKPLE